MLRTQKQRLTLQPTRANDLFLSTPQESKIQLEGPCLKRGSFFAVNLQKAYSTKSGLSLIGFCPNGATKWHRVSMGLTN